MFQITILATYLAAGGLLVAARAPERRERSGTLAAAALALALLGLALHGYFLAEHVRTPQGLRLGLGSVASLVAWQIALIAALAGLRERYRGLSGVLLVCAGVIAVFTGIAPVETTTPLSWQLQSHVLLSLFAYSLLSVGAVLALAALYHDYRLRSARLSGWVNLMPPLQTMEGLLSNITGAGFVCLLLAVFSGLIFLDDMFAQQLAHKTVLSLLALLLFAVLLLGRHFAGWRGAQAIYLYLGGFSALALAYFGSKFVLEVLLGERWG